MFNLLPGDRLWNRFRVDEARNHGAEGAWLSLLQDVAYGETTTNKYLLVPMAKPHRQPLADLLSVIGSTLRHKAVVTSVPKPRRSRKEKKPSSPPIPQRLPLAGELEWIGDPGRDGVAIISAPQSVQLSRFIEAAGALSPAQALQMMMQLTDSVQQLLILLSTSRRPLSVSQELLKSIAAVLNPDCIALCTKNAELLLRIDIPAAPTPLEPPAWADFVAPEVYRGDDLTPSSLVFSIAKLTLFMLGAASKTSNDSRDKRKQVLPAWAALAEWASGKRDPVREFSADSIAAHLPECLIQLLSSALARNRSARISSPEKLLLRLKHPEFAHLLEALRCANCGFTRSEKQDTCLCCGKDQPSGSASVSSSSRQSVRLRRGNTTTILKNKASAAAVMPKIEGMTLVEAGAFLSGEDRTPRTLRAFAIDTVPVTEGDYKRYLAESGKVARINGPGSREGSFDKHPVTGATWYEANEFAEFYGKRLPTIYEWEKAARGTDGRKFTFGNSYKQGMGRLRTFEDGRRSAETGTAVVGSYPAGASPYGVLDMSGNVLQWTSSARRAGERLFRAVKGSCYLDGSSELARCTSIQYLPPETSEQYLGFRCVKDLE